MMHTIVLTGMLVAFTGLSTLLVRLRRQVAQTWTLRRRLIVAETMRAVRSRSESPWVTGPSTGVPFLAHRARGVTDECQRRTARVG